MISRYFQQELAQLRELGEEFARAHPAVAPMLGGAGADPDVERLLEGVAFLTAQIREKIEDDFPEIIHELIQLIWPHYLRPIPCTTVIAFKPKPMLKQPLIIARGAQIASVPVEGTPCLFRTCCDVELHPLHLLEASYIEAAGRPPAIRILLELRGMKLADWTPRTLRLFLGGGYAQSADLYLLLCRSLHRVLLTPAEGGASCALPPDALQPAGFSPAEALLPYPPHSFPGYRILQEYFILPEKFCFLDLNGWERWRDRGPGDRFEIVFELNNAPSPPPRIRREHFVLGAATAVNLFGHDADPIRLDHRTTGYPVRPSGVNTQHYQVYDIQEVIGVAQGSARQRVYQPFEVFSTQEGPVPVYQKVFRPSPVRAGYDVSLSVSYPPGEGLPAPETLSIRLLCTNGALPENLRAGDIALPTSRSPEFAEFANIRPPAPNILPPLGSNLLWRLLGHLSLNYLSLQRPEHLQALLELYIFPHSRDRRAVLANRKRIEGIQGIHVLPADRLISGIPMRGRNIILRMRQDHFAGAGDLFLFGCVLDYFLGVYASLNTFTRIEIEEVLKGERLQWPARVGDRFLI